MWLNSPEKRHSIKNFNHSSQFRFPSPRSITISIDVLDMKGLMYYALVTPGGIVNAEKCSRRLRWLWRKKGGTKKEDGRLQEKTFKMSFHPVAWHVHTILCRRLSTNKKMNNCWIGWGHIIQAAYSPDTAPLDSLSSIILVFNIYGVTRRFVDLWLKCVSPIIIKAFAVCGVR